MGPDTYDRVAARAEETGELHAAFDTTGPTVAVPAWVEVKNTTRWLRRALEAACQAEPASSSAAEWLLDNAFHVQRAVLLVKQDLPFGFYRQLRPAADTREPMALELAHDIIEATHFQLSRQGVITYLQAYQKHNPLDLAELWALPVMLRIACIERLTTGFSQLFPEVSAPFPASASCRRYADGSDPSEYVSRGIANLGAISRIAWKDVFDETSLVEHILAQDPCGIYSRMDFETRDTYRRSVERLARNGTGREASVAEAAVNLATNADSAPANHVGHWLIGSGLPSLEHKIGARPNLPQRLADGLRRYSGTVYTISLFLLGLAGLIAPAVYLSWSGASGWQWVLGLALSALPSTVLAVTTFNWLVTLMVPPRTLPKLDFSKRIDPEWTTLVAVPVIVGKHEEVPALLRRIEGHWLANPVAHGFVLLSDPGDASTKQTAGDAVVEEALREGISALNRRHGKSAGDGPFTLLHRARQYNPAQGCWMAWERKRGKLEQFNRFLLTGDISDFPVTVGPIKRLIGARFVVTADADTRLPANTVARMAATLAHPLNRPLFDTAGRVVSGYTVLQPRVEIAPLSSDSHFARLFGGDTAIDIYSRAVSDVYQDLVGTGNYVGKGIYDVSAFARSLEGRIPENNLLSHDLWEGLHGRAGLASDIIVYESFPANYGEYAKRWHRWVRGDWQLLPWLFPYVPGQGGTRIKNRLSLFDRMRIWDTMRRSLVPASVLMLLLGGWFLLPGNPAIWTLFALLAPAAYLFTDIVSGFARGKRRGVLTGTFRTAGEHFARSGLSVVFLISDTAIAVHAIGTTLLRLRRGTQLLEWTSAAHVSEQMRETHPRVSHWRSMWMSPAAAVLILAVLVLDSHALLVAAPLLFLWFIAPEIAWWSGRETKFKAQTLDEDDKEFLRLTARRSWLFFENHVRPEDNWLPPDNHQEEPVEATARRTSPTNIGMMVLAALSAWRLGHLGAAELTVRIREMLDTLDRLEHWRGHILNWYDTGSLAPLEPRYVSTVDSGNLAVSLATLACGCAEIAKRPAFEPERWTGLSDCLALIGQSVAAAQLPGSSHLITKIAQMRLEIQANAHRPDLWPGLLNSCEVKIRDTGHELKLLLDTKHAAPPGTLRDLRIWTERTGHHLRTMKRDMTMIMPWLDLFAKAPPECRELASKFAALLDPTLPLNACGQLSTAVEELRQKAEPKLSTDAARQWLAALMSRVRRGLAYWRRLERRLDLIARRATAAADGMDFTPLFDPNERLFHIGYDLSADRLDQHHYDLLASEARLASFFAIAKHEIPPEHWFHLGRPIVKRRGELALVSWNGSMFEYLMPSLFLRSDPKTLLGESDRSAVDIQRRYAAARGTPWGISESGFAATGPDGAWRYRAFGVPELGLRRGLAEDMVISPYSTALALAVTPRDAVANLRALAKLGALGQCGFYEALDFTDGRRIDAQKFTPVRSYMAHHHGMSIAAIANALFDNIFVEWFHADPRVQTVELLLNERVPWELPAEIERLEPPATPLAEGIAVPRPQPWEALPQGLTPLHLLIGNGRMKTQIASDGSGMTGWKNYALTRPGEAQGGNGHFLYLRDLDSGETWSPTPAPLFGGEDRRTLFHAHKAEFHCRMSEISTTLEVLVATAEDVEIRRLRLVNGTPRQRRIEVASHTEIALAPSAEWLRHPAFAKLFVKTEAHPSLDALLFERRTRNPGESSPFMVQRLTGRGPQVKLTGWEVARNLTRERYGDARNFPLFANGLGNLIQYPLDPASALRAEIVLPPHGEVELAFVTAVATSREDALELARRYGSLGALDWAEQDVALRAARDLHMLGLAPDRIADAQLLFSALNSRPGPCEKDPGTTSRDELWALGISGDLPILLVELREEFGLDELRFLLASHLHWRRRGASADLALLHPGMPGYVEPIRERLLDALRDAGSLELLGERGGVHIFGREQIEPTKLQALRAAARSKLTEGAGSIRRQLALLSSPILVSPPFVGLGRSLQLPPRRATHTPKLHFANGLGGFTDLGDYHIDLQRGMTTPAPWVNVLANQSFGSIVSEAGLGCTYAGNAGENRLTPWHNDPLADPQGEALYLRDEETGTIWSVSPLPAGSDNDCQVEHRMGETVWSCESEGLVQEMACSVAVDDPVKIIRVTLSNRLSTPRRITATYFVDWLLGAVSGEPGPYRKSWYRADLHALLAQNRWHRDFAGRTAFLTCTLPPHSLSTSRQEFLGGAEDWRRPHGLTMWELGDRAANFGEDAAAALQVHVDIPAGGIVEFAFVLGQAANEAEAQELVSRWRFPLHIAAEPGRLAQLWSDRFSSIKVSTPDPAFDLMVNRWLPYQAISSRLFARAGFYQAGGAFGFRDQLQDVLALLLTETSLAREQILRAAAHQFEQGDVLHWWHPPHGRGVRTRYSDDLLWLPHAVARYVEATGDLELLNERVPFLQATELSAEEHDRYAEFPQGEVASVFEHCLRAFDRCWKLGEHGLPLIGEGDWNDGMNRVGVGKKGESVWLGWFLAATIRSFGLAADRAGHHEFAKRWFPRASKLVAAIDRHAWDGAWYIRAFDDLGRPWGSKSNEECRIDSLAQSWAIIAGGADHARAKVALDSAFTELVRADDNIVRLLDPPFGDTPRDPGYIKAYPPGIRENGGQYSHAAAWLGIAAAMVGDGDRAKLVFDRLNPVRHAASKEDTERYLIEPYVVAGDIGGTDPHCGRGGWSWYTGAASWTWRLAVEYILGVRLVDGKIALSPCLPAGWAGFSVTMCGQGEIEISVERGLVGRFEIDGNPSEQTTTIAFPGPGKVRRALLIIPTQA
ncbi:MAG: cellobiose phosphorylase [Sphingorhabdus sp.]|uniref:GH36-type glycosyl hydrolase domain-containing protein n=1 Tax=Sphingorhabdus sp. TaxID=1902408 RepID=UPI0025D7422F|nr:glucoamylase family protein [Sphingorhabdus sp.]MCO4090335.1 cellobiose phosphorylase [Sphingorhabdus sp.]